MTTYEYTPTTEDIRPLVACDNYIVDDGEAAFDRWLTAHDAQVFEAGRREGAETALKYAADNIVFSDEWRNHGNNDPRLDGEAEASAWLEVEASRPLPLTAGDLTETGTPDA